MKGQFIGWQDNHDRPTPVADMATRTTIHSVDND